MKILLCSYFKFPSGCAGAIRHEKFAQMLMQMGHEVLVVALGPYNGFQTETFKGIPYTSLRLVSQSLPGKVKMRLTYWKKLKKIADAYTPDCILMDDMRPSVTVKLKRYAKKRQITLVHDSVEWYSKEQFKRGVFALAFVQKNIVNRFLIDKSCRVISISEFLHDYYTSKGIQSVNIPIVASDEDLVQEKDLQETVNFTYAGQAGKKDYLHVMLSAMALLSEEERKKFKFHILGCTAQQMIENGIPKETLDMLAPCLEIYGRVPRDQVLDVLKMTDFTILMRSETQRYAKAGFPTKSTESLSHTTPMIANITSDLGKYLVDGYNSLIVSGCTPESLAIVLRKAISLSKEERAQMCQNAYDTAMEKLHADRFIPALQEILN